MRSDDGGLWTEVAALLGRRPGWKVQMMPTPGMAQAWGFGSGGETELSIPTEGPTVCLYLVAEDREITFADADELGMWLAENRPDACKPPKDSRAAVKRGRVLDWD